VIEETKIMGTDYGLRPFGSDSIHSEYHCVFLDCSRVCNVGEALNTELNYRYLRKTPTQRSTHSFTAIPVSFFSNLTAEGGCATRF
jgi:hypothetical protein